MRLLTRMSTLVTANLNDLIDQCEDPEKMLRQAVREMEASLGHLIDGAAGAIAQHKLLLRQLTDEQQAIARCTALAAAAVARADDEAARRELLRKAEHQQVADALTLQVTSADQLGQRLRRQVTTMRIKMAEARRKLIDITTRNRAAAAQRNLLEHLPCEATNGRVWSNFNTMYARLERTEAETEALLELLGEPEASEALDAEIETELQALKEAATHVTR
jgi:phage shock protein A